MMYMSDLFLDFPSSVGHGQTHANKNTLPDSASEPVDNCVHVLQHDVLQLGLSSEPGPVRRSRPRCGGKTQPGSLSSALLDNLPALPVLGVMIIFMT